MNLKDMKYFITICDKKSITAASESLYISPQALSKTIQKLEKNLGVRLLIRSNNGVEMTPYGKILYDSAGNILMEYADMTSRLRNLSLQNQGIIRMASAYGILRFLTPEFVNSFSEKYPDIHLEYMEFPDRYVIENILDENYDIGLIPYTEKNDMLEYIDLFRTEIYFITHKGSRFYTYPEVLLTDAAEEPFLVENKNFVIRKILLEACRQEHVQPKIYFNTSGFSLCYKLCREGKGNTVSMSFIYEDMKDENLRMIPFKEHPVWKVAAVYRKGSILSDNIKKLLQFTCGWCDILESI